MVETSSSGGQLYRTVFCNWVTTKWVISDLAYWWTVMLRRFLQVTSNLAYCWTIILRCRLQLLTATSPTGWQLYWSVFCKWPATSPTGEQFILNLLLQLSHQRPRLLVNNLYWTFCNSVTSDLAYWWTILLLRRLLQLSHQRSRLLVDVYTEVSFASDQRPRLSIGRHWSTFFPPSSSSLAVSPRWIPDDGNMRTTADILVGRFDSFAVDCPVWRASHPASEVMGDDLKALGWLAATWCSA